MTSKALIEHRFAGNNQKRGKSRTHCPAGMLKVTCVKYEDEEDENQIVHTYYIVLVEDRERSVKYTLHKRYSDFLQLYMILREKSAELDAFRFPNKSIFNNRSRHTLDRRLEGFNEFLQLAAVMKPLPKEVLSFLEIPDPNAPRTSSSSSSANGPTSVGPAHHNNTKRPIDISAGDAPDGNSAPYYNENGSLQQQQLTAEQSPFDYGSGPVAKYSMAEEKVKAVLHLIVFIALVLSIAIYSTCVFSGLIDVSQASKSRILLTLLYMCLLIAFLMAAVTRVVCSSMSPRDKRKRRKVVTKEAATSTRSNGGGSGSGSGSGSSSVS